jgi:acyl carrier protein
MQVRQNPTMAKLDQLVVELFGDGAAPVGDETPFAQTEGWDSLKHVELIVALETRFAVELTAEEIERLTCPRAAREILMARHIDV